MKVPILLFALLAGSCALPTADRSAAGGDLAGRTPGDPRQCISLSQTETLRTSDVDPHSLIYGSGGTLWVNRIGQCAFGSNDLLVTEPMGSYLCRGDLVRSFDRTSHVPGRSCVLGDFVPYHL